MVNGNGAQKAAIEGGLSARLMAEMPDVSSYNQLVDLSESQLNEAGVDGFVFFSCLREAWEKADTSDFLITTRGPENMKPYEAMYLWKGYKETDLALAAIAKATEPFSTDDVYTPQKVTRDQKDLIELTERYHLHYDLFVPVHTPGRIQVVYFFVLGDQSADEQRLLTLKAELVNFGRVFALAAQELMGFKLEAVPNAKLSVREHECLTQLGRGLSNPEIAVQLNITERTVKYHINNLMKKLGASSRIEVVAIAARTNLMSN